MSTNPNEIKSQHEMDNQGMRSTDVLLSTIDELADVKEWQKDMQAKYGNMFEKCERLQKQLDRAIWWLNEIVTNHRFTPISTAEKALAEIKGVKNEIPNQE